MESTSFSFHAAHSALEIHNVSMIPRLNMGFPAATLQSQKHQVSGWKYLNRSVKKNLSYPITVFGWQLFLFLL